MVKVEDPSHLLQAKTLTVPIRSYIDPVVDIDPDRQGDDKCTFGSRVAPRALTQYARSHRASSSPGESYDRSSSTCRVAERKESSTKKQSLSLVLVLEVVVSRLLLSSQSTSHHLAPSKPTVEVLIGASEDSHLAGLIDTGSAASQSDTTSCSASSSAARRTGLQLVSSRSRLSSCTCRKTCRPVGCVLASPLVTLDHVQ